MAQLLVFFGYVLLGTGLATGSVWILESLAGLTALAVLQVKSER